MLDARFRAKKCPNLDPGDKHISSKKGIAWAHLDQPVEVAEDGDVEPAETEQETTIIGASVPQQHTLLMK